MTLSNYLSNHKETIFSLIYMDFDIYEPTKEVLNMIKNRVTKGTIIGFDELCIEGWPGETEAFMEIFGSKNFRIERNIYSSAQSFIVFE